MIYLVYKTDSHHSYASRDIIAIATNTSNAVLLCREQAEKEGEKINTDQMYNLQNIKQTQGYSGEGEFQYEGVELDVVL